LHLCSKHYDTKNLIFIHPRVISALLIRIKLTPLSASLINQSEEANHLHREREVGERSLVLIASQHLCLRLRSCWHPTKLSWLVFGVCGKENETEKVFFLSKR